MSPQNHSTSDFSPMERYKKDPISFFPLIPRFGSCMSRPQASHPFYSAVLQSHHLPQYDKKNWNNLQNLAHNSEPSPHVPPWYFISATSGQIPAAKTLTVPKTKPQDLLTPFPPAQLLFTHIMPFTLEHFLSVWSYLFTLTVPVYASEASSFPNKVFCRSDVSENE